MSVNRREEGKHPKESEAELGGDTRPGALGDLVGPGQLALADDELTVGDDVADVGGGQAEEPVPGEVVGVDRRRRRVVENDDVGRRAGLDAAEERLVERDRRERGPTAASRSRVHPGCDRRVVLVRAPVRGLRLREQVAVDPVGPERHVRPERGDRGTADAVVHVGARVVRDPRAGIADQAMPRARPRGRSARAACDP